MYYKCYIFHRKSIFHILNIFMFHILRLTNFRIHRDSIFYKFYIPTEPISHKFYVSQTLWFRLYVSQIQALIEFTCSTNFKFY